jgi:hypothetical protein
LRVVPPHVCYPTAVLDFVVANLPVLDAIHQHVEVRCLEWHVMDETKPIDQPRHVVVPLIRGHTSGVLRRLHLRAQRGMIACFAPENRVQLMRLEGLDRRGIGTQTIFGDVNLWGVVLPELGHAPLSSMAFASIFGRAILWHHRLGHQRHHGTHVWGDHRRAPP